MTRWQTDDRLIDHKSTREQVRSRSSLSWVAGSIYSCIALAKYTVVSSLRVCSLLPCSLPSLPTGCSLPFLRNVKLKANGDDVRVRS
jgi:hypothetical protein